MMVHEDDGKELGIFANGDEVVIACRGGHFWVLQAEQVETATTKRALEAENLAQDFPSAMQFMK